MRRFGGATMIANLMERFGFEDDVPIESQVVSNAIENAQVKVEAYNFDMRKHVVEYDDVMNKHREVFYGERKQILSEENLKPLILKMVRQEISQLIDSFGGGDHREPVEMNDLLEAIARLFPLPETMTPEALVGQSKASLEEWFHEAAAAAYDAKEQELGTDLMRRLERAIMLQIMDSIWTEHLTALDELREGIGLRAYGQRDPLVEYKNEAHRLFQALLANIQRAVANTIYHVTVRREPVRPQPAAMRLNRDDGTGAAAPAARRKIGRNDPCPCGSGRKYKHCALRAGSGCPLQSKA
ncbi:MAG: SEC-C domain-containing protein [Chloroflexi bacterium]|nr:SEC-C domain-containing protein [Chloroflexota bacterium]